MNAPLVFVGYGISAPEYSYDEYQGLDTKGKIVLVLGGELPSLSAKSSERGHTPHESVISKAINAKNHGAAALILVNGKLPKGEEDLLPRFGDAEGPEDVGILCLQVKNAVADAWLRNRGTSLLDRQREIDDSAQPSAMPTGGSGAPSLSVTVNIETIHATVNNVLAYLPGKTDEYVILGAHYDHLGHGQSHSLAPSQIGQIHPGADDNASGTAGVLELARLFAPLKGRLRRGILFANFAGEELGLLGSAAWVKNPTLPLDKAVAMLNMDMIGRIKGDKVYIGGLGTGSTFQSILDQAESHTTFKYENSPEATPPAITPRSSPNAFPSFSFFLVFIATITNLPTPGKKSTPNLPRTCSTWSQTSRCASAPLPIALLSSPLWRIRIPMQEHPAVAEAATARTLALSQTSAKPKMASVFPM